MIPKGSIDEFQAGSRGRDRILAVSILVNLVLICFFWFLVRAARQKASDDAAQASSEDASLEVQPQSLKQETLEPVAAKNPEFHWSQIESPDYREYISNLRAIGCPEATIRDIIT